MPEKHSDKFRSSNGNQYVGVAVVTIWDKVRRHGHGLLLENIGNTSHCGAAIYFVFLAHLGRSQLITSAQHIDQQGTNQRAF